MNTEFFLEELQTKKIGKALYYYDSISSTQTLAKELVQKGIDEGAIVIADEQTSGRGRLSHTWNSKKGLGIWMSMILRPHIPMHKAPQINLLTAVAICKMLNDDFGIQAEIKWPNDILVNRKKICGILTELITTEQNRSVIIVGIGINVNHNSEDFPQEIRHRATSLYLETEKQWDRRNLVQLICQRFEGLYELYLQNGFTPIKYLWETYEVSIGNQITARTLDGTFTGVAIEIDEDGVLQLEMKDGTIKKIYAADIELL